MPDINAVSALERLIKEARITRREYMRSRSMQAAERAGVREAALLDAWRVVTGAEYCPTD